jgi:putative PIN family toxin of toxin-antitoxin system
MGTGMKKIVIDTNVYVSSLIFGGTPLEVVIWCQNYASIFISLDIINEIKGVLEYKFLFTEDEIKEIIEAIVLPSKIVFPKKKVNLFDTGGDNRIIECAIEAGSEFIISGDQKHLIKLRNYKGIEILTPKEFLRRFKF